MRQTKIITRYSKGVCQYLAYESKSLFLFSHNFLVSLRDWVENLNCKLGEEYDYTNISHMVATKGYR